MTKADDYKRAAAAAALALVDDGMTLGLGTGSTAAHFIDLLGKSGRRVVGVVTSEATTRLAAAAGVTIIEPDETTEIDLAVDGADEIALNGDLIKGGGAALLREKIIAAAARRFVVIADRSKCVTTLGAFPLPVEISRFSYGLTMQALRRTVAAFAPAATLNLRFRDGAPVLTDGGNYVVDCAMGRIDSARALDQALIALPGVLATGLFLGLCDVAFVAGDEGVEQLRFNNEGR